MLLFFVAMARAGTAVVELFTSEGCSSCPPADALLSELAREGTEGVILLELHVDYWDRLGWPDPRASSAFSDRQRRYGQHFGSVYTPQMVVDGQSELVGSNRAAARAAISKALATPDDVRLVVEAQREGGQVRVTASGTPAGMTLVAAVIEDGVASEVRRGENAGKSLLHDRVVRAWIEGTGPSLSIPVAGTVDPARSRLVVFAQDPGTLRIVGATERPLP